MCERGFIVTYGFEVRKDDDFVDDETIWCSFSWTTWKAKQ